MMAVVGSRLRIASAKSKPKPSGRPTSRSARSKRRPRQFSVASASVAHQVTSKPSLSRRSTSVEPTLVSSSTRRIESLGELLMVMLGALREREIERCFEAFVGFEARVAAHALHEYFYE